MHKDCDEGDLINSEIFQSLPDAPFYLIDKLGNLYNTKSKSFIKFRKDKDGYLVCNIRVNGIKATRKQHRLLAIAWIPNPENKRCINHKDGVKDNNCLTNLEWATHKENMEHSIYVLGNPKPPNHKGKTGIQSKLSIPIVAVNSEEELFFYGAKDAMRISKGYFTQPNIWAQMKGKVNHHRGYKWYRVDDYLGKDWDSREIEFLISWEKEDE